MDTRAYTHGQDQAALLLGLSKTAAPGVLSRIGDIFTGRNVGQARRGAAATQGQLTKQYRDPNMPGWEQHERFGDNLRKLRERSESIPKEQAKTYASRGAAAVIGYLGVKGIQKLRQARAARQATQSVKALPASPKALPPTSSAQVLPSPPKALPPTSSAQVLPE